MSQKTSDRKVMNISAAKGYENVPENWILYDTVLIGLFSAQMNFNTGYFPSYATLGAASEVPFFNVRNRNHGLAYNNQDTRDQIPYVFKIFTVGVAFFGPSTPLWVDGGGPNSPYGAQNSEQHLFETELPKHCSLTIQTNQDERLEINSLMAPPGYGPVSGGYGQGSRQIASNNAAPDVAKGGFTQGVPNLQNKWGFTNPLEVPRRSNLSAKIHISEYGRQLLQAIPGPYNQIFRKYGDPGNWIYHPGFCGIQIVLGGQRQVQQRGQYHA